MAHTPGPWKVGEENVGGGFNIYAGPLRIAHTAIQARAFAPDSRTIGDEEAKANARRIVEAVNFVGSQGVLDFARRCLAYLEDAPLDGRHSDAAGANAYELIQEASEWALTLSSQEGKTHD